MQCTGGNTSTPAHPTLALVLPLCLYCTAASSMIHPTTSTSAALYAPGAAATTDDHHDGDRFIGTGSRDTLCQTRLATWIGQAQASRSGAHCSQATAHTTHVQLSRKVGRPSNVAQSPKIRGVRARFSDEGQPQHGARVENSRCRPRSSVSRQARVLTLPALEVALRSTARAPI